MAKNPYEIPAGKLASGVEWFDDWYTAERVAPGVTAIGEIRYHYLNWNYLIEGENAALMFDTGPGDRNIAPVAAALTTKPVAVLASHMHYDHTGNMHQFDAAYVPDIPALRACERNGEMHVTEDLHLCGHENRHWTTFKVSHWIKPGEEIDLGGRRLEMLATPGHALDHVALFDKAANILFAADFIYPGELYGQLPGSDLADYLATAEMLADTIDNKTLIVSAHGKPDANNEHACPKMSRQDTLDLIAALKKLKSSGEMPARVMVNASMELLTAPSAFAAWQRQ